MARLKGWLGLILEAHSRLLLEVFSDLSHSFCDGFCDGWCHFNRYQEEVCFVLMWVIRLKPRCQCSDELEGENASLIIYDNELYSSCPV